MTSPRQTSPYAGSPLTSSVLGMPTSVMIPTSLPESGLKRLYEMSPGLTMPLPLSRDAFPLTLFWEECEWERWKKREKEKGTFGHRIQGEGVNSSWIEDKNGGRVDRTRQKQILAEARHQWVTMRDYNVDVMIYTDTPMPTVDYFRAKMETTFPELQLCADHWKVKKLWMENFSSWNSSHRTKKLKEEPQSTTLTPGAQDTQSPDRRTPDDRDPPGESSPISTPGSTTESPVVTAAATEPQSKKASGFQSHESAF